MHQVSLRDSRSARNDRRWIEGVYRDYLTDLAPASTGIFPALSEVGHREPDQLLRWFGDHSAQVLTILYDEQPVGFAMVHRRPLPAGLGPVPAGSASPSSASGSAAAGSAAAGDAAAGAPVFSMGEFFIGRQWRRRGIGAQAVRLLFDRFDGQWLITEHLNNTVAVKFWRRVVAAYTRGKYQERIVNGEVQQQFQSGRQRR